MIDEIITDILKAEGWDKYTDHPADRGGPTKWGVTLKAYQEFLPNNTVTAEDIKALKEVHARAFYRLEYITKPGYNTIRSDFLMALVVDAAVNHGTKQSTKWLQRAVGAIQDGSFGPKSRAAVDQADPTTVALKVLSYRVKFYGYLVTRDPTQAVFAHGWNSRAAKWLERLADLQTGG